MSQGRDYQALVKSLVGMQARVRQQRDDVVFRLKNNQDYLIHLENAQVLLQQVAKETQEQLKIHIEDIVQLALDAVFPDKYVFEIQFNIAYGKTTAELVFVDKLSGYNIDPMIASGGGVVDICALALRVACWTLSRGIDNVLIMDEPLKFLSRDLREKAGLMLKFLSQKIGLQIIMITHLPELIDMADQVFECTQDKEGVSHIRGL